MLQENKSQEEEKKINNKTTDVLAKTNTKFLINNLEKRILLLSLTGK